MRHPLGKALWSFGFLALGVGLVLHAFGSHADKSVAATNAVITPFVVGLVVSVISLPIFLRTLFSAIGYARLMSGKGVIARWHVTAVDWDRFREFDKIRAAEHEGLQNDMHIRDQTLPQGVDVIVGRSSIIVDGSYHNITGLEFDGRKINWLNAPVDPECIEFPKTYSRRGGSIYHTLRVPVTASARAEGVRVFEHYHQKENTILNPTPASVRRDGAIVLVLSLFVIAAISAVLTLTPLGVFLFMSDAMRLEKFPGNEEVSVVGIIIIFGFLMTVGLLGSITGLSQIISHKRNGTMTKIMWAMLWLFFIGGTLLQLVYLWIK